MSKKILFSDFDGTLYINGTVNEQDRNAIRRWRADGNLFAMASGRDLNALKTHLIEENVEWDFLLCLNGAEAYDHCDRLLFETPIDIKILPGLYRSVVQDDGWANIFAVHEASAFARPIVLCSTTIMFIIPNLTFRPSPNSRRFLLLWRIQLPQMKSKSAFCKHTATMSAQK